MFPKLIRTLDYSAPWQVRCASCGTTKRSGEAGAIRIASRRAIGNRTMGFCRRCQGFKWLVIEPLVAPEITVKGKSGRKATKPA